MRLARRVAVWLALGAVTTLLVAWACAAFISVPYWSRQLWGGIEAGDGAGWVITAYARPGVEHVEGYAWTKSNPQPQHGRDEPPPPIDRGRFDWAPLFDQCPMDRGKDQREALVYDARGWPMPSFSCRVESSGVRNGSQIAFRALGGAVVASPSNTGEYSAGFGYQDGIVILPWRPIMIGFVVDTLVFATAAALAGAVARWIRSRCRTLSLRLALTLAIVLLALGAVTTIVVALACAIWVDEDFDARGIGDFTVATPLRSDDTTVQWEAHGGREPGAMRINSWTTRGHHRSDITPNGRTEAFIPSWASYLAPTDDDSTTRVVDARGWPFLSFWGGFEVGSERGVEGRAVIRFGIKSSKCVIMVSGEGGPGTRTIPLAPIWAGFLADMLIYAGAWSLLLSIVAGPRLFVRSIRAARGSCMHCGYPLRALTCCPECGENRVK